MTSVKLYKIAASLFLDSYRDELKKSFLLENPESRLLPRYNPVAWVKVFRIIPEFRILRLIFQRKSVSKYGIRQIMIAFLIYLQFYLKTINHLNLKY